VLPATGFRIFAPALSRGHGCRERRDLWESPPAWRSLQAPRAPRIHGFYQVGQQTILRCAEMASIPARVQRAPAAQPLARSQQRWLLTASASPGTMGRPCWIASAHQPISRRTGAMRPSSQVRV